ncbi:hypothetical protein GCM10007962_10310 [Yeosuana aromativorans]|uniref:DUF2267 domain-containing protein n=1 Tax=Yeosuana aromativorans TaxID=288019 RepID=A0A8J3FIA5_9FLAO|nr:DUF2267 domain-containing protein [Yeosuana aromativorans]GGK18055.1 hypothetical protein GCM10007962_10310 [Yeosuana aromativorans]
MALNFTQFATEGNTFLKKYAKEMNLANNTDKAGRILSSILHALRDVITTQESLQLISQFPMFLKAVYVNGWTIQKRQKIKTMTEFIDLVRKYDGVTSVHDFESDEVAENYIDTTFIILRKYISLGELEDLRTVLPKNLKSMIYQNIMF